MHDGRTTNGKGNATRHLTPLGKTGAANNSTNKVIQTIDAAARQAVPTVVAAVGPAAVRRFATFFTDNIRNPNTRAAYHRNACRFFAWCRRQGIAFEQVESFHVSAYIEELMRCHAKASVKQHLAAIRMLYDWLIVGQVVAINPAQAVRGPKLVVKRGKTPVLDEEQARHLIQSIDTSHVVGLRDRALIALMVYSFARVEAALQMNVRDYYPNGKRWWIRLHEKGGKHHEMPAHHKLEQYLDAYLFAAGISDEKGAALFRTAYRRSRTLTQNRMTRSDAYRMIRRRARDAGINTPVCCHAMRATGITNYMQHGGTLERAKSMACHESSRTTQLYIRTQDAVTLEEVERVRI